MPYRRKPVITIAIIVLNTAVFLGLSLLGQTEDGYFMLEHGAMYLPYVLERGEYYRIFACIFMHFGLSHLINNMVMLYFLGSVLEEEMGKWKYLLLYLLSGIGGNLLSAASEFVTGDYTVSAGASGAVFGIIGALFFVVIRNHGHIGTITWPGIVFMALCSLYHGFTSSGVDNLAHIGGLLSGLLLAVLLYRKHNRKRSSLTR